jgi:hypothetical protein
MRRVFEGGVGTDSGGREERSMDMVLRESLEMGRDDGGDASMDAISKVLSFQRDG